MTEVVWKTFSFTECTELLLQLRLHLEASHFDTSRTYQALLVGSLLRINTVIKTIDLSTQRNISDEVISLLTQALDTIESLINDEVNERDSLDDAHCKLVEFTTTDKEHAPTYLDLSRAPLELLGTLDKLCTALERTERQTSNPEPISQPSPIKKSGRGKTVWHDLHKHVSTLVTGCVQCGTHGMRLLLASCELQSSSMRLLCAQHASEKWHPVDFHLDQSPSKATPTHAEVCSLCESLKRPSKYRAIRFDYNDKSIWPAARNAGVKLAMEDLKYDHKSLESWLSTEPYRGHRKALQCVLAQWLGRAYDTPWLPQTWNTKSIWLDTKDDKGDTSSYRTSAYSEYQIGTPDPEAESKFMIKFALLLLRIEVPTADLHIEDEDTLDAMDLDDELSGFLLDPEISKDLSPTFLKIIDICQNWTGFSSLDRTQIFNQIFAPLKRILIYEWALDLPEIPEVPMAYPSEYHQETKVEQLELPSRSSLDQPPTVVVPAVPLRLFDDEINTTDSYADEFFRNFKNYRDKHALAPGKIRKRVKIAVLDTGLNQRNVRGRVDQAKLRRKHLQFSDPESKIIVEQKTFVAGSQDCKDECGHGTRVLDLLLRTAPDACYYIAKVSENDTIHDNDVAVDSIVKALDWAMEKEVDLINMSFGFIDTTSIFKVQQKLAQAHGKGIKMFAAAANHGHNGPRAYPARAHEVICINASNGRGSWATDLNPHESNFADRFSAVGLGIDFMDGEGSRSGTSYATPVAIGIVSNAIDYVRHLENEKHFTAQQAQELEHIDGIKHMMNEMSIEGWLAPWHVWKDSNQTVEDVKYKLKMK